MESNKSLWIKFVALSQDEMKRVYQIIEHTQCDNFNKLGRMIARGIVEPVKSDKYDPETSRRSGAGSYERKTLTLTLKDGEAFEAILNNFGCNNVNQFYKKIANGEIVLKKVGDTEEKKVLKPKSEWYGAAKYQTRIYCTMTLKEGPLADVVFKSYGCNNVSQFVKSFIYNRLVAITPEQLAKLLELSGIKSLNDLNNI